jgi:hypothetical protein
MKRFQYPSLLLLILASTAVIGQSGFGPESAMTRFNMRTGVGSYAVADLNEDGLADIVYTDRGGYTLNWIQQTQPQVFGLPIAFGQTLPEWSDGIAVGDINGDGHLDVLAACNHDGYGLYAMLNDGSGSFSAPVAIVSGVYEENTLAMHDLTGDGRDDIVIGSRYITYKSGEWQFVSIAPDHHASDMFVFDADMDNDLDIALQWMYASPTVDLYLNNGDGTTWNHITLDSLPLEGVFAGSGDFNSDGWPDLAYLTAETHDTSRLGWFVNPGPTGSWLRQEVAAFELGRQALTGDFNADGRCDLMALLKYGMYLFPGDGASGFGPGIWDPYPDPELFNGIATDLDGDGKTDLLVRGGEVLDPHDHGPMRMKWTRQTAEGFTDWKTIVSHEPFVGAWSMDFGDWDNDGDTDGFSVDRFEANIHLHLQDGPGSFAEPKTLAQVPGDATFIRVQDLNNDDRLDILVSSQTRIYAYNQKPDGSLNLPLQVSSSSDEPRFLTIDLNKDGYLDVVANGIGTGTAVHLNQGDGSFGDAMPIASSSMAPYSLASGDMNGDGWTDIVLGTAPGTIDWIPGNPGGFDDPIQVDSSSYGWYEAVECLDADLDGDLDIAYARSGDRTIGFFYNDGTGHFSDQQTLWNASHWFTGLDQADVDRDGDADLAFATDHALGWWENGGAVSSWVLHLVDGPSSPDGYREPVLVDIDRDLAYDLAYIHSFIRDPYIPYSDRVEYFAWRENQMVCGSPTALEVSAIGTSSVDLRWSPVPKAEGYLIRGQQDGDTRWRFQASAAPARQIDWSFAPGASYTWQVKAICPADTGPWSKPAIAVFPFARTGEKELQPEEHRWKVFPNPAASWLWIQHTEGKLEEATLRVTDAQGRLVLTRTIGTTTRLELNHWSSGTYLLELWDGQQRAVFRVLVP